MDFDLSKENIQPLRGGRIPSQLGLALQAESSNDMRRQLQHQREFFENSIRNYHGDDPLENWYQFITWVEQSYPKNGHEGNLIQLLEQCLHTFENDKRYMHDRRFCKLWIKYIDSQQNPIELYQMMHARGTCIGCADLYKAWAYYHEAAGDYKSANSIFELGKQALAQPFEELELAHQNLVMAAGTHMLYGPDEQRLLEKRQALTSLRISKSGIVNSIRNTAAPTAGVLPMSNENLKPNAPVPVYQDPNEEVRGAAAPPVSLLTAVKRQEAPKENILKPGPWTTMPLRKKVAMHHAPTFSVHVDDEDGDSLDTYQQDDLHRKPHVFPPKTKETYVDWIVMMTIPEPVDNRMQPMYPKSRVYADPTTEYSLEELVALKYQKRNRENLSHAFALSNSPKENLHYSQPNSQQTSQSNGLSQCTPMQTDVIEQNEPSDDLVRVPGFNSVVTQAQADVKQQTLQRNFLKPATPLGNLGRDLFVVSPAAVSGFKQATTVNEAQPSSGTIGECNFQIWASPSPPKAANATEAHTSGTSGECNFQIWASPSTPTVEVPRQSAIKFYEQTHVRDEVQPKGSAMKTPFRVLSADDLAETGSRGSTDTANAAQPVDSASTKVIFDDDSNSSFEEIKSNIVYSDLNSTCNTQAFNFNLNAMKVSTPQPKQQNVVQNCFEQVKNSKKQLFEDESMMTKKNEILSIIAEESRSYRSSSSSSGVTTKSSVLSSTKPNTMSAISEEHNSYLAQNRMANEALRKSLAGLLPSEPNPPLIRSHDTSTNTNNVIKPDQSHRRLDVAPSDPFLPSEIQKLLNLVSFPGPHVPDFHSVPMIPRLSGKKEPFFIGQDHYLIEKVLGKGTFGTVYKALDTKLGKTVALKYQKPANKWEFYICREIQTRLRSNPLRERFMDVTCGYFSDQASILVYSFMPHGSLLDLANQVKLKTGRPMQECLCFYFCIQMLRIVEAMHQVKIIHADIKPDNFLIQLTPDNGIELQLIDFGCSIDMSLYPPNTAFTRKVTTESFICCEMQENKPWNYHTDIFCVAATTHVILFDKYIELQKKYDAWCIKEKIPRYMNSTVWNKFFNILLNQQNEVGHLQVTLDEVLSSQFEKFTIGMKALVNLVNNR